MQFVTEVWPGKSVLLLGPRRTHTSSSSAGCICNEAAVVRGKNKNGRIDGKWKGYCHARHEEMKDGRAATKKDGTVEVEGIHRGMRRWGRIERLDGKRRDGKKSEEREIYPTHTYADGLTHADGCRLCNCLSTSHLRLLCNSTSPFAIISPNIEPPEQTLR